MSAMDEVHREAMADYRTGDFYPEERIVAPNEATAEFEFEYAKIKQTMEDAYGGRYIERDEIIPWATWIKRQRRDEGIYDLMDRVDRGEYDDVE